MNQDKIFLKSEKIFFSFLLCVFLVVGFALFIHAIDATETMECKEWRDQAREYPGFYITKWQKMQCDARSIAIDAPVR